MIRRTERILDDAARVATSAVGILQGAGNEAEGLLRQRLERILARMDLVSRDEFDAVKAMAENARVENETLRQRIAILEEKADRSPPPMKPTRARSKQAKPSGKKVAKPRQKTGPKADGGDKSKGA